jgi:hypothetical protein
MKFKVAPQTTIQLNATHSEDAEKGFVLVTSKDKFYLNRVWYGQETLVSHEPRAQKIRCVTVKKFKVNPITPWRVELFNPLNRDITVEMTVSP